MLTSLVFNIIIKTKKYFKIYFEIFFKLNGRGDNPRDKHFCCVPCTTYKIFYKKCKKFYTYSSPCEQEGIAYWYLIIILKTMKAATNIYSYKKKICYTRITFVTI